MLTGAQYRASLQDGRRVYSQGRRIEDVTTDPLTRKAVDWVADGYDAHYDPTPGAHGPYYFIPRSAEELKEQEERQKKWDFPTISTSTGLLMLLNASSRMGSGYPQYAERVLAFFDDARDRDVRAVLTITDAKGDRSKSPKEQDDPDLYLRIVDRQRDGVVLSGAKMHISSAVVAHELLVMPTKRMKSGEEDYAIAAAVPMNAPGITIVNATFTPRPDFDERFFPYSSKVVMTEGMVVFDNVFVPTERVFLAGEVEHSATFAHCLGLWERLGSVGKYVDVADTLVGLAQLISEANGTTKVGHIRDKIGEMIVYATMIRGSFEAAVANTTFTEEGYASPDELFTNAAKYYASAEFSKMVRHLHDIAGGSVLTAPTLADLENPDTAGYVAKYLRTGPSVDAEHRLKLFHAIRDYTADAYGGWQHVTMLQAGGGLFAQQIVAKLHYDMDHAKTLAKGVAAIDS
ncbi:MAG: 4-hydroxyphenylacetate 3-hydroxylase N-terminal domain-containing protein [Acidimicrobiales bacterium]